MGERNQRRPTAAARRERFIDVGRAVFARRRCDGTAVGDVAERAKVWRRIICDRRGEVPPRGAPVACAMRAVRAPRLSGARTSPRP